MNNPEAPKWMEAMNLEIKQKYFKKQKKVKKKEKFIKFREMIGMADSIGLVSHFRQNENENQNQSGVRWKVGTYRSVAS